MIGPSLLILNLKPIISTDVSLCWSDILLNWNKLSLHVLSSVRFSDQLTRPFEIGINGNEWKTETLYRQT